MGGVRPFPPLLSQSLLTRTADSITQQSADSITQQSARTADSITQQSAVTSDRMSTSYVAGNELFALDIHPTYDNDDNLSDTKVNDVMKSQNLISSDTKSKSTLNSESSNQLLSDLSPLSSSRSSSSSDAFFDEMCSTEDFNSNSNNNIRNGVRLNSVWSPSNFVATSPALRLQERLASQPIPIINTGQSSTSMANSDTTIITDNNLNNTSFIKQQQPFPTFRTNNRQLRSISAATTTDGASNSRSSSSNSKMNNNNAAVVINTIDLASIPVLTAPPIHDSPSTSTSTSSINSASTATTTATTTTSDAWKSIDQKLTSVNVSSPTTTTVIVNNNINKNTVSLNTSSSSYESDKISTSDELTVSSAMTANNNMNNYNTNNDEDYDMRDDESYNNKDNYDKEDEEEEEADKVEIDVFFDTIPSEDDDDDVNTSGSSSNLYTPDDTVSTTAPFPLAATTTAIDVFTDVTTTSTPSSATTSMSATANNKTPEAMFASASRTLMDMQSVRVRLSDFDDKNSATVRHMVIARVGQRKDVVALALALRAARYACIFICLLYMFRMY